MASGEPVAFVCMRKRNQVPCIQIVLGIPDVVVDRPNYIMLWNSPEQQSIRYFHLFPSSQSRILFNATLSCFKSDVVKSSSVQPTEPDVIR
jgi:hypothetical protein